MITIRLFGDLKATSMDSAEGTFKLILGILSFGLLPAFLPGFVEWSAPPTNSAMRRKTQRRSVPLGYPSEPTHNAVLARRWRSAQEPPA